MTEPSPDTIELSVIAPVYNEELIIQESVQKLREVLADVSVSWELILVDDGSSDNTHNLLCQGTNDDDRITVLHYHENRGRGYALRTGLNRSRGEYVVTTEADLNYGKEIISRLWNALQDTQTDVVIASPYMRGGKLENVPWKRALLSRLGNRILRMAVPTNISTVSGMVRGYKGNLIRSIPLEEDGKEIHLEIISKACMLGARFSEIPAILRWNPPEKGQPKRKSKFRAGKLIRSHLLFSFNEAPIFFFGTLGIIACLIGVACGSYLSWLYFIKGQIIGDRVALILTTIFLTLAGFSTFLFCFLSYQIKDLKKEIFKIRHKLS
jgi:dolichol-phosphate mannosyltransferase